MSFNQILTISIIAIYILGMPVFIYFQSRYWNITFQHWEEEWDDFLTEGGPPLLILSVLLWPIVGTIALILRIGWKLITLGEKHRLDALNPEKRKHRGEQGPYR